MNRALITVALFAASGVVAYALGMTPLQTLIYGATIVLCDRTLQGRKL